MLVNDSFDNEFLESQVLEFALFQVPNLHLSCKHPRSVIYICYYSLTIAKHSFCLLYAWWPLSFYCSFIVCVDFYFCLHDNRKDFNSFLVHLVAARCQWLFSSLLIANIQFSNCHLRFCKNLPIGSTFYLLLSNFVFAINCFFFAFRWSNWSLSNRWMWNEQTSS
jgi:hypothetical protein